MKRDISGKVIQPTPILNNPTEEYDVFLSFSGEDTCYGFPDELCSNLVDAGLRTFKNDNDLRVGEELGPELLRTIEKSKISIPIFSKNYANCKWCLRELTQMVECRANGGQMIFPIFYDVEPNEVQHYDRGSYKEAFLEYEKSSGLDEKTVQQWKTALEIVGELKGFELKIQTIKHEVELVKIVVRHVLLTLKESAPKILVGMDHHVAKMEELLNVNSNGVRVVVIHGAGGIGKTTIAEVIYNELRQFFECCYFLEDVRTKSKDYNGLVNLQNRLISNIQKVQSGEIVNVDEGMLRVRDAVHRKKVLIVLDDADEKCQFDMLVGKYHWYGVGSKIIVTARNEEVLHMLESMYGGDVCRSYSPQLMSHDDSLKLFNYYAFRTNFPLEDYRILSDRAVYVAAGLPLVLVTMGSLLFGEREKYFWEAKLRKLLPHREVSEKLRISFDALNYKQKQIFLDIACLFIGEDKIYPSYMWDECQFDATDGLNALVLRSLVKVGDDNRLWMHDQLRDLGRQIVREDSFRDLSNQNLSRHDLMIQSVLWHDPWYQSRLWCHEEAFDLLMGCKGTEKVVALHLDFVRGKRDSRPMHLVREGFQKLSNLRFLSLGSVDLDGDFEHLFPNLRWLKWAPLGYFSPTNFHLRNLIILDLSYSQITDDWKGWSEIKIAKRLKVLNLSHCYGLSRMTHFSMFETLERLILSSCFGLDEIDPSMGNLINLRALDLSNCLVLRGTLDCSMFANLESLDVHSCTRLCGLHGLGKLSSLRNLNTSGCRYLLRISDLSTLNMLKKLDTSACTNLIEIQGLGSLESLESLDMSGCISMEILPDLPTFGKLEEINISKCDKLLKVESLGNLESLVNLEMSWCTSLESIPDLSNLKHLKKLKIGGLKNLQEVLGLEKVKSLELLDISGCRSIKKLPDLSNLIQLKEIYASRCVNLIEIGGLDELWFLELLDISGCESIEKLPDLSKLKSLKVIKASGCMNLYEIRGLEELKSLILLDLSGCKSLENLPDLPSTRIEKFY